MNYYFYIGNFIFVPVLGIAPLYLVYQSTVQLITTKTNLKMAQVELVDCLQQQKQIHFPTRWSWLHDQMTPYFFIPNMSIDKPLKSESFIMVWPIVF